MPFQRRRVSVMIPAFNMERNISETLDSLQRQTLTPFEVNVVNDRSTDATAEIAMERVAKDARFRYLRLESDSGRPAVPRDRGIAETVGEYVAFLDPEDLWPPRKIERRIKVLDARPDLAMVHSHLCDFTERSKIRGLVFLPNPYRRLASYDLLRQHNVFQRSATIVRLSFARELVGLHERPELRAIEDYHLWLRVSQEHKIAYISEIHRYCRCSPNSTSTQETLQAKHRYLDENASTPILSSTPSLARRASRKIVGYPLALCYHLLDGGLRQLLDKPPRVFEVRS